MLPCTAPWHARRLTVFGADWLRAQRRRHTLPGVSVCERLRERLAAARRAGESFDDAWPKALEAVLVGEQGRELVAWTVALNGTLGAWRAGWERVAADGPAQRALSLVADSDGREPILERACERCAGEIPPSRGSGRGGGSPVRYCSRRCQRAASGVRPVAA